MRCCGSRCGLRGRRRHRARRHRGQDRRGRATRGGAWPSGCGGGKRYVRPRVPPASGGARCAHSRLTASMCSCNSPRPSTGRTRPSVWSPRPWTCRALSSTSSAPPTCPSSATSRSIRPDCWRERCQFRTKRRRPSRTPPTNNAARCTSRTIRRARRRCSPRPGPIWWRWRKRTSTRPRTPRARREDRRSVLRRTAADVGAGQAGQQPAEQPLPAIGGQELLLSRCGGPLRNRNHLGEAVGCPTAGGRPVRDAVEQLSFRRGHPAAPARSAPWPRCRHP